MWAGVLGCFEQRASQAAKEREVQVVESSSRRATGPRQGPRSSQGRKPACSEVIATAMGRWGHGDMGTWRHICGQRGQDATMQRAEQPSPRPDDSMHIIMCAIAASPLYLLVHSTRTTTWEQYN
ncbi:hypothetical protein COCCADRAFT_29295 [Bipolaris zeicola 26-R-13]|uniref:Uncharacterized protein n=1 Tax=Cochliobolus carbonum (strain 26-R-13) TaxID=930089 RepID=W6XV88_COCC2|nr:uncharacterized protein COCCADRAFT_29295 [Bipolaris zeicola 26-R-13]EUC29653.1 hypothetical protein COCCADRAFT_29295 [Bipolaris zeicola 26-R-13]